MVSNKFKSPLYLYTKTTLDYLGKKNIGKEYVQEAYDAITKMITDCCVLPNKRTRSQFLKGFYTLLPLETSVKDYRRLKEVQTLLHNYIDCCS